VTFLGDPPGELVYAGVPVDSAGAASADDPPHGRELAPAALRSAGLVAALGAADDGDMPVRIIGKTRDPVTGVVGWTSVAAATRVIRSRTSSLLAHDKVPVLIGGCCTLLPGALAGARDVLGPVGLAYIHGHIDLHDGETSPTGEAADMPIAVISGLGPASWCEQVGAPVVAPERLALLGPADRAEAAAFGSALPEDLQIDVEITPASLRALGVGQAAQDTRAVLGRRYWVHLGVDVLDNREFPAVNYPNENGLTLDELAALLLPLIRSGAMAGFSLACYNPGKDPGGCALTLTDLLGGAFTA
jgi:arginase